MAATRERSQSFQRSILKLLDRALGPCKFLRDLTNTFLFDETFDDDGTLIVRKIVDELKQDGAALDIGPVRLIEIVGNRIRALLRELLPPIGNRIRRDSIEPDGERYAPPFELGEIRQRVLKHFGGHVFSLVTIAHTADDERIHALEIPLV